MSKSTIDPKSCDTLNEGIRTTAPGQIPDDLDEQIRVPWMCLNIHVLNSLGCFGI